MNTYPLEDRVCLITGGLGGIGLGVTELVLKRGGKVFLVDMKEESEAESVKIVKENKDKVAYAKADVTCQQQFEGNIITSKGY